MRTCRHCDEALSPLARADSLFCSGRCRVAAHRARRRLPAELTSRPRWVRHSAKKVPLTVDNHPASSTNPRTWSSYDEAVATQVGAGLGFVLNGDGVVCIDIDHCVTEGRMAAWAAEYVASLPDTYVEFSPSGAGLHVWGRARRLNFSGRVALVDDDHQAEFYANNRYITVTGRALTDCRKLADLTDEFS